MTFYERLLPSKTVFVAVAALILALVACPAAFASEAPDAKVTIEKMINQLRGRANIASYEMTLKRPTWSRSLKMKVWDDHLKKRYFIRILAPAKDQGTSFLRLSFNLWNYLPNVEKSVKIPPSLMLQPWMGSDFTNDDLVKESSYVEDYTHRKLGEEEKNGKPAEKIELLPKPQAPVVWEKVVFWVWKGENLPLEQDFYDAKGNVVKMLSYSDFKKMDGVLIPSLLEMKALNKEEQSTQLRLETIDFDPQPAIPDALFTEQSFGKADL